MFSKSAVLALLSGSIVSALPGYTPWNVTTPVLPVHPVETECATTYSTSTWVITSTIPIVESKTTWISTNTIKTIPTTKTSLVAETRVITTSTPTCYTSSYPVTMWVTTVVDDFAVAYQTEACTETSTWVTNELVTVATGVPSVEVCTEYSTSLCTESTVVASTTCTPCATPVAPTWK